MRAHEKTRRLTGLALMTAIVIVLQLVASALVKVGVFAPTLTLAPILIGAAIYGPKAGAYLGGVFGVVVTITCIIGWDAGGNALWNANPFLTALICIVKGVAGGPAGAPPSCAGVGGPAGPPPPPAAKGRSPPPNTRTPPAELGGGGRLFFICCRYTAASQITCEDF